MPQHMTQHKRWEQLFGSSGPQAYSTAVMQSSLLIGELVDSLKEDGDKVIAALDELLTRWR